MFKATVIVRKRPKILDPQGKAVEQGAKHLGFNNVLKTRIGKYIEFFVDTNDQAAADKYTALAMEEASAQDCCTPPDKAKSERSLTI